MDDRTEPLPGGVWRIEVATVSNVYLVARDGAGDADGLVLVDTGPRGSGPRLVRSIRSLGFDPRRVSDVLLTHWHPRHAGSTTRFASSSAAPRVHAGPEDAGVLSTGERPATGARTPTGRLVQRAIRAPGRTAVAPLEGGAEPVPGVRVIAAPGHTAGHRAFWFPATGLLLAGDALHHLGRLSLEPRALCADLGAAATTLRRLAELEPVIVACGHGPPARKGTAARLRRLAERAAARVP